MEYQKHVGIYNTYADLEADLNNLISPWVAYVQKGEGFEVYYSNDKVVHGNEIDIADDLNRRLTKLENEVVTLTESEYELLLGLPEGETMEITDISGNKKTIAYNASVRYYTYESEE